ILIRLKAGLNALADAIQEKKIKFKASLNRKVIDRRDLVVERGVLDDYRLRFSTLDSRKSEIESSVSIEERRELEKSLERAEWEKRDVTAEIAHHEEQIAKVSARLKILQKRLEKSLSGILRGDIEIEFPDEVKAIIGEELTEKS
ncbi:MAG: hypothetical protein ACXACH_03525, partial [Candidatus Hermodarchaeia archaeon]